MKTKLVTLSLIALMASAFFISCDDDNDNNNKPQSTTTTFRAAMNGSNEVPLNPSSATGAAVLTFDSQSKVLSGAVSYSDMTVTAAHIHKGEVGVSGDVVFPITVSPENPFTFTSPALTAEQEADLNAGRYYINLHSDTYPEGEIRGQLVKDQSAAN
jgi:hypothetical protein